jgi:hypothetical protein
MFLNKVLSDTQSLWPQPEREACAVYWFVTNRSMLLSSKTFIYNDCRTITQAFKRASTNNKINGYYGYKNLITKFSCFREGQYFGGYT